MTVNDTDKFLANRSSQSFQVEAQNLMAELQDEDLMLINRGGVSYKATGLEIKDSLKPSEPATIKAVSLTEQEPDSRDRFTNQKFDVGVTTNVKAAEPVTYGLKAKVTGDLVKTVETSEITSVDTGEDYDSRVTAAADITGVGNLFDGDVTTSCQYEGDDYLTAVLQSIEVSIRATSSPFQWLRRYIKLGPELVQIVRAHE